MKNLLTFFFALSVTVTVSLDIGFAQSGSDRRPTGSGRTSNSERAAARKGLFTRLFEQRQNLDAVDQKRVAAAVTEATGTETTPEEALLLAREAMEANPDAVDQASRSLLENKDRLLEEGTRLLQENGAADVVEGLSPVTLRSAVDGVVGSTGDTAARSVVSALTGQPAAAPPKASAAAAVPASRLQNRPVSQVQNRPAPRQPSSGGGSSPLSPVGPRLLPVDPGSIPMPHDPIRAAIPRPELDPNRKLTRITAESSAFDANTNVVNFEGNVELDHPEFDMSCDILIAELQNSDEGTKESSESATQKAASGGIEKATATGYVVIEKLTADGTQVAKARKAVYDAVSGIVTLSDFPVMQDGKNVIRGTEASTRIFLRPDGKYNVDGPAKYEIQTNENTIKVPKR